MDRILEAEDPASELSDFRRYGWPDLVKVAALDAGNSLVQLGRLEFRADFEKIAKALKTELKACARGVRLIRATATQPLEGLEGLEWLGGLELDEFGKPKRTTANLAVVFEHHHAIAGRVRLNTFTDAVEVDGRLVRDDDYTTIQIELTNALGAEWTVDQIVRTVGTTARRHSFDPLVDYFDALEPWDGTRRLDWWLSDYLGVEDRPLVREYAKRFLVSVVARALRPGCQVDTVLVLQGKQGDGKSSAIRVIAPCGLFSDTEADPGSKDFYQSLSGSLLVELAEVEKWNNRRDSATIKSVITSRVDRFRPPYGRNFVERPRRCVFVGTTNEVELLNDPTGSRRWWPVKTGITGPFRLDALKATARQLWAEALALFNSGEPWHLGAEWRAEQDAEAGEWAVEDPWLDPVRAWLVGRDSVTLLEIMAGIGIEVKDANTRDGKRVGAVLRRLGYEPRKVRGATSRIWMRGEGK
jgi:predicted P-loop ATPase